MLTYFVTYSGLSVAISANHVILTEEVPGRDNTKLTLVDGGVTEVRGSLLDIVAQLNSKM